MVISANTPGAARWAYDQEISFFRKDVAFNTPGIDSTGIVWFGTLPANAIVVNAIVKVTAGFNAVTTNVLTLGDATTVDSVFGAGDVNEGVIGTTVVNTAVGYRGSTTADTPLYVKYTQSGTAATAGAATIILMFVNQVPQQ